MQPNVIVVVFDAGRRDAFEPYGAEPGATPVFASLARRGAAFEDVYATGCWTAPSHASIFTGKLPRAVGLAGVPGGRPPDVRGQMQAERDRLLPWVMRQAGYRTMGASANLWISAASGFDEGFDSFAEIDSGRQGKLDPKGWRQRLAWWREAVAGRVDDGAAQAERELVGLFKAQTQPFFCFVNLVECHSPYLPPRPFGVGGPLERIRAAEDASRHYTLPDIWRTCLGGAEVPAPALRRLRRQYKAAVKYMDAWLGRLIEGLEGAGVLDDTLVIVTSDHGENFGEGGLIAHGLSLDNRLIHVPFVVAGPRLGGSELHSLAALPRFIAEAAGVEQHPWRDSDLPQGMGIAQHDPPVDPSDPIAKETVIDSWGLDEDALAKFTTPLTCAVMGRYKILCSGTEEFWLDLEDDPLELAPRSLAEAPPEASQALERLRAGLRHEAVTTSRPFATNPPVSAAPSEELDDLEERMRLLGYL